MDDEISARPYVAAYLREHLLMTAEEMTRARQQLIESAKRVSLQIDEIFIERLESSPEAFEKLAARVATPGVQVIIIPGIHHLANLGSPPMAVVRAFAADGVQVLIAGHVE